MWMRGREEMAVVSKTLPRRVEHFPEVETDNDAAVVAGIGVVVAVVVVAGKIFAAVAADIAAVAVVAADTVAAVVVVTEQSWMIVGNVAATVESVVGIVGSCPNTAVAVAVVVVVVVEELARLPEECLSSVVGEGSIRGRKPNPQTQGGPLRRTWQTCTTGWVWLA